LRKIRSKMTYTGPTFEVSVNTDSFAPRLINHHGLMTNSTCFTHDSVHSLTAIANLYGNIKLFGKNGVEVLLPKLHQTAVRFVGIVSHQNRLISMDDENVLHLWDLKTYLPLKKAQFEQKVACYYLPFYSEFFYFGTQEGNVFIFDLDEFSLCAYSILPKDTIK